VSLNLSGRNKIMAQEIVSILNEEHISAGQDEANAKLDVWKKSLQDSDQKKFNAVSQCFAILRENNVAAFIFPMLPRPEGGTACFQYNNALDFIKYDKNGRVTVETMNKLGTFNSHFIGASLAFSFGVLMRHNNPTWEEFNSKASAVKEAVKRNQNDDFYK